MRPPQQPAKIVKYLILAVASLFATIAGFMIVLSTGVAAYAVGYSQVQGAFIGLALLLVWNFGFALAKAAASFDPAEIDDAKGPADFEKGDG